MNEIDFLDDNTKDEVTDGYKIDSLEKAEWAMRKINRAEKEIEKFENMADKLIDQIKQKLEQLKKPHERTIENMKIMIEPWVSVEIAKQGGKKRSYNIIGGRAGYRTNPNSIEITDEQKAIDYLESHFIPDCVVIKKTVSKQAVKDLIKLRGEIPDGIEIKTGEVKFYVNTDMDMIEEEK